MASSAFDTFAWFPYLPAELQKQVWEQAASDLPVLYIQQFTAEIVLTKQMNSHLDPAHAVLCFTPHPSFVNLTAGYRGLFGACQESRKAAQRLIHCLIPIHYPKMGDDGNLVVRQAMVPFEPSGRFCITGLARAMMDAQRCSRGARGSQLLRGLSKDEIQVAEAAIFPIKNLMIALEPEPPAYAKFYSYMGGWDDDSYEFIASRLPNLETASVVGEAILARRHYVDQPFFDRMSQSITVKPKHERGYHERAAPWKLLWDKWKRQRILFYTITWTQIEALGRDQFDDSEAADLVDSAAMASRKTVLELNLSAAMG